MAFIKHQEQTINGKKYEYWYIYESYYTPEMDNPTNFKIGKVGDSPSDLASSLKEQADKKGIDVSEDEIEDLRQTVEKAQERAEDDEDIAEQIEKMSDDEKQEDDSEEEAEEEESNDYPERAEQHALVAPVKVSWSGKTREKVRSDLQHVDILDPVFESQKTNIVVKTEEQVNELLFRLHGKIKAEGEVWSTNNQRAIKRVHDEIVDELEDQGYVIENHKIQDLESSENSSVKTKDNIPEGVDKDRLEDYLEDYKEDLEDTEEVLNEGLEEPKKIVIDYDSSLDKRREQIIEAFEGGVDIGGLVEEVIEPEEIKKYKGEWIFSWRPKYKKKDRFVEVDKALDRAVVTDDEASVKEDPDAPEWEIKKQVGNQLVFERGKYEIQALNHGVEEDNWEVKKVEKPDSGGIYDIWVEDRQDSIIDLKETLKQADEDLPIESVNWESLNTINKDSSKGNDREFEELLSQNVPDVKDDLSGYQIGEYPKILEEEKNHKDRKTVIKAIKERLDESDWVGEPEEGDIRKEIERFLEFAFDDPEWPSDDVDRREMLDAVTTEAKRKYFVEREEIEEVLDEMIEEGELEQEGNMISRAEDDDFDSKQAVKELTREGAIVGKEASEVITKRDVRIIENLDTTPMYISEEMIRNLRKTHEGDDINGGLSPSGFEGFDGDYQSIEVIGDVPEFMGVDGEVYGEFSEGDTVELPWENAEILVNRGLAEEVEDDEESEENVDVPEDFNANSITDEAREMLTEEDIENIQKLGSGFNKLTARRLKAIREEYPIEGYEEEFDDIPKYWNDNANDIEFIVDEVKNQGEPKTTKVILEQLNGRSKGEKTEWNARDLFNSDNYQPDSSVKKDDTMDNQDDGKVKVEFLQKTPEFMGTDLESYGSFEKGDNARIPRENAEILENRGNVEVKKEASNDAEEYNQSSTDKDGQNSSFENYSGEKSVTDKVMHTIDEMDDEEGGAGYPEVFRSLDISEEVFEETVEELKNEGVVFEPRPGKLKLLGLDEEPEIEIDEENIETEEEKEKKEREEKLKEVIEDLDDGDGADYKDIVKEVDISEKKIEDTINRLLNRGSAYEPRPGHIKLL